MLFMKINMEKVLGLCKEEAPNKRCQDCACTEEECAECFIEAISTVYNINK